MENTMLRKMKDDWEEFFFGNDNGEKELFESVTDMEANSQWIPGISSRDIRLEAIDGRPMFIQDEMRKYHLDEQKSSAGGITRTGSKRQGMLLLSRQDYQTEQSDPKQDPEQ